MAQAARNTERLLREAITSEGVELERLRRIAAEKQRQIDAVHAQDAAPAPRAPAPVRYVPFNYDHHAVPMDLHRARAAFTETVRATLVHFVEESRARLFSSRRIHDARDLFMACERHMVPLWMVAAAVRAIDRVLASELQAFDPRHPPAQAADVETVALAMQPEAAAPAPALAPAPATPAAPAAPELPELRDADKEPYEGAGAFECAVCMESRERKYGFGCGHGPICPVCIHAMAAGGSLECHECRAEVKLVQRAFF